ncbi:dienelactone hydrolase family protein [Paenibacillus thailandensis]|uniref:Dienelactone hydrolase family protein n=1 Tax=Paenibacillus thailandensis TaxID=393250 RepID=A0ABW5R2L6_9BACL
MKLEHYLDFLVSQAAGEREAAAVRDGHARRLKVAADFRRLLGEFRAEKRETEPLLIERAEYDGYVREHIEIETVEGLRMRLYVLIPARSQDRPCPAVIALHGHGYGSRQIVGLEPDGTERTADPGLHRDFAVSLVKEGFVVAAPELIGFGDRRLEEDRKEDPGKSSCFRLAAHLLMTGRTLAGLRIAETSRVVDYLVSRSDVDAGRIGMMGISGGGLVAGFTAALDERIRCSVVSGYASLFAESILSRNHCLDNYIPGVLTIAEMPELLGLIAPRGLFLESGDADRVFPREPAVKAYRYLKEIYASAGAPNGVQADFFAGGHEINGGPAFRWLRDQLQR